MNSVVLKNDVALTLNTNTEHSYSYTLEDSVHATLYAHISKNTQAVNNSFNYTFVLGERSILNFFVYIHDIEQADISITLHAQGKNAQATCRGLYILEKNEEVRIQTFQQHTALAVCTDVLVKGLITDSARAFFKGTIFVDAQGAHADATLYNKNILLSSQARAIAMPQLEVVPHNVRCKHGSATSQLDQQQVLYAQARGLDERTAKTLLLESFVADCITEHDALLVHRKIRNITGESSDI